MGNRRLVLLASLVGLFYTLLPERAEAQICDRAGYTREASCPNEARDATGCCPAPRVVTPRAPQSALPPAEEACPLTQVRTASGRCCWPGQRETASGCAGRPRSCPLGWERHASGCLPTDTRSRAMVAVPPPREGAPAFVIDRTPVTVQAYRQCVDAGACEWREPEHLCNGASHRTHPMNCVSHFAAAAYCNWAGLSLPSEAEWVRAAGGGDGRRYPWGDELPDDRRAHWGQGCHRPPCTASVGRRPAGASPYGALEMAGNVWEWTTNGIRGGHWTGSEQDMRLEARRRGEVGAHVGFRCVGRDLDWNYVEALGESDPPVAESRLEAPFRDLARAYRHVGRGEAAAAAERFEAAIAALEALRHSRAFVFRYHAGVARERAGDRDAAVAHITAYFEAGGVYPAFDAPWPLSPDMRFVAREAPLPRWARRGGLPETLGPAHREGPRWAIVEVLSGVLHGDPLQAEASYLTLERQTRLGGHAHPEVARAHLAAAFAEVGERERAAHHLAVYLDANLGAPPEALRDALSEELIGEAQRRRGEWQEGFQSGEDALGAGDASGARRAWEGSYAGVEGHPEQAGTLLGLALAHEQAGDWNGARSLALEALARSAAPDFMREARSLLWAMDHRVVARGARTCALGRGGEVSCWGSVHTSREPGPVLPDAIGLAVGGGHTCALRRDGRVACWGYNTRGQLGIGFAAGARREPSLVQNLDDAVALVASANSTCALRRDGRVACWGRINAENQTSPTHIVGLDDVVALTAEGSRMCGLRANGAVWCSGSGASPSIHTPGPGPQTLAVATGGEHTCAIRDDEVYCWDENGGQAIEGVSHAVALSSGPNQTCALSRDGGVACWTYRGGRWSSAASVSELDDALAITVGGGHTCATRRSGDIVCWGANGFGQLGDGTRTSRPTPVRVAFPAGSVRPSSAPEPP